MDKKTIGIIAAAMLAALSGGAEVLSIGERVEALEKFHPELDAPEAPEPAEEPEEEPEEEPAEEDEDESTAEEPEAAPEPAEEPAEPEATEG